MTKIIPIILAGGVGSRLWPVSRKSYPKQFCTLLGDQSLLQETVIRANKLTHDAELIIITNDDYYFLCKDQLDSIGVNNVHYILEPCPKNTAPAIALAASYALEHIDSNATLLILPADHHVDNHEKFNDTVKKAIPFSDHNKLVVFGVRPTSPKTGYGYIEQGSATDNGFNVKRFVEKPSRDVAKDYLAQGGFYWNSGMFLFKAKDYLDELTSRANDIYLSSTQAYHATKPQHDFFRVDQTFNACREGSIDYEVMEKTNKAVMLPLDIHWNDLGCWTSVAESNETDEQGNVLSEHATAHDSTNCFISSEKRRVIALGLSNQIIVSTPDAVLVADKAHSQDVKKVVEHMILQSDTVATKHQRVHRPWGFFESLSSGPGYQVKHLIVNPGATLSLQLHHHRCEHWVVVSGTADVVCGDKHFRLTANQSTYIKKETKHRLSNPGEQPLSIIEVQSGDYLGEDDIVRFDDVYGRAAEAL